jgi:hypothetical protein
MMCQIWDLDLKIPILEQFGLIQDPAILLSGIGLRETLTQVDTAYKRIAVLKSTTLENGLPFHQKEN